MALADRVMARQQKFFPLGLSLAGRKVVVIGGGKVAERKVRRLVEYGTKLTVISPEITAGLEHLLGVHGFEYEARSAREEDLAGASLVFVATSDPEVNQRFTELARARLALVNRADQADDCDFVLPALGRCGPLQVGVFSDGEAPILAQWVRDRLEPQLSLELDDFVTWFTSLRNDIIRLDIPQPRRAEIMHLILDSGVYDIFRTEGSEAAIKHIRTIVDF